MDLNLGTVSSGRFLGGFCSGDFLLLLLFGPSPVYTRSSDGSFYVLL